MCVCACLYMCDFLPTEAYSIVSTRGARTQVRSLKNRASPGSPFFPGVIYDVHRTPFDSQSTFCNIFVFAPPRRRAFSQFMFSILSLEAGHEFYKQRWRNWSFISREGVTVSTPPPEEHFFPPGLCACVREHR